MCQNPEKMINLMKKTRIVRSKESITLVGSGQIGPEDLDLALIRTKLAVAADGGAASLLEIGRIPDAVIGDFDSLDSDHKDQIPLDRLFPISEQNSTDFDKALRSVEAPLVIGVGFLGGRLDHQLAALNVLVRRQDQPCILIGESEIIFHAPPQISVSMAPRDVVSLFPLQRVSGQSRGLEWPIDGLVMEPNGAVGTSNRALGSVELRMDGPGLLVMFPRAMLDQVMQALLSGPSGRWPAHAE